MASYLAVGSSVDALLVPSVLEFVFSNDFFLPVAVGGVATRGGTYQWFLAGYALNRFVERYIRNGRRTSNITTSTHSLDAHEHIGQISSSIRAWRHRAGSTSPFERIVADVQTSFMPGALLSSDTISEVCGWLQTFPAATLHIVGCVNLTGRPENLPWDRSFRHLPSSEAAVPFVELLVRPQGDHAKRCFIEAFSGTEYWSVGTQAGCNLEALENLSRYAAFIRSLLRFGTDTELRVEGAAYHTARDALANLFGVGLPPA